MVPSSTSYLQTLSNNEATAFLSALQKVKDHLSEELQWMNQQVQQKTLQLQGIKTLLAEAEAKGLIKLESATLASEATPSEPTDAPQRPLSSSNSTDFDFTHPLGEVLTAASSVSTNQQQIERAKQPAAKTKQTPKASTASKGSTTTKKTKSTSQSKTKGKQTATSKGSELRELLQPAFQDKTFGDVVSEILQQASQPLHIDDLIDKMYNNLSDEEYQRAKVSLANVLSVGSGKGRWKNVSKGMYASNAVAAS